MTACLPNPDDIFEERYRIVSQVGAGGFAKVFKAVQMGLGRPVALKVLSPPDSPPASDDDHVTSIETLVKRFRREAKLVSRLRDPHTITMHDYGQTDAGNLYMVFEYVDGQSLDEAIARDAPMSARRVVGILAQCLSSLQEAHSVDVLHRDIKPGNIMLFEHVGRADQVKVLDFGIAKSVLGSTGHTQQDLTRDDVIVGTPRYMSPEQLRGQNMGPGTDLYSLGLVAFELLVGRKAIPAKSTLNIISQQLDPASVTLPQTSRVPGPLRDIINRMLSKDVDGRYQSAREILADLDELDGLEDIVLPEVAVDPVGADGSNDQVRPQMLDNPDGSARQGSVEHTRAIDDADRSSIIIIAGAMIVVAALIAVVVAVSTGDTASETAASSSSDEPTASRRTSPPADDPSHPAKSTKPAMPAVDQGSAEVVPKRKVEPPAKSAGKPGPPSNESSAAESSVEPTDGADTDPPGPSGGVPSEKVDASGASRPVKPAVEPSVSGSDEPPEPDSRDSTAGGSHPDPPSHSDERSDPTPSDDQTSDYPALDDLY